MKRLACAAAVALVAGLVACTSGEAEPSGGTYTVKFPSTAAAVATDFVVVLVFDIVDPKSRETRCQDLVAARKKGDSLRPDFPAQQPPPNICELLNGKRPLTLPYGEKALLAIAQRKNSNDQVADFMIGCTIATIGDGDAPVPIELSLVDVAQPVPATTCGSVGEWCASANLAADDPRRCQ
jgi:hypothetical protein